MLANPVRITPVGFAVAGVFYLYGSFPQVARYQSGDLMR